MACASPGGVPAFDAPIEIQFPNKHFPTQLAAGDFDGDGQLDLVVPGRDTDGLVYIVTRLPDGSFVGNQAISLGVQTDWAETADFDGDGKLDIALAVRATFGAVVVLRGRGDGTFDPPIFLSTERETRCVRVADVDRDGRPDLIAVNYASGSIEVLHNDSVPGHMAFLPTATTRMNRWAAGTAFPNWAELGDFNHDGWLDIVDVTAGSARLDARLNTGGGLGREHAWASPLIGGVAAGFTFAATADLDGDGNLDVVAHLVTTNRSNPMAVWRGTDDGSFEGPQLVAGATTGTAFNVAAADMDGDGDVDLIALAVQPGQVSIIENRTTPGGPLVFAPAVTIATPDFPRHVLVLDFDHDGKPDLAISDYSKHKIILLRNAGAPPSAAASGDAKAPLAARVSLAALTDSAAGADESEEAAKMAIVLCNIGPAITAGFAPNPSPHLPRTIPQAGGASCGPPAGDCLVVHGDPFCFTTPCCEIVCGFNPSCCESTWDSDCVYVAGTQCQGIVCPSRGSCTEAHAGPGCEDAECCQRVTRLDPSCLSNWDDLCVELMTYACIGTAPTVIPPAQAIDEAEHCYERISEGCGRRSNPAHVPVAVGEIRRGVITADGSRDVDAHMLTLTQRQQVSLRLHADFPAQLVLASGPCDGPLVTYAEALAPAGAECRIDRVLEAGEWRITVGMATPSQTIRYGQPCMDEDPAHPWNGNPPVPGFFGGTWWMSVDASEAPKFGDLDGSGFVDSADLGLLLLSFGEIESGYDLNGDGQIDAADLGLLLLYFD